MSDSAPSPQDLTIQKSKLIDLLCDEFETLFLEGKSPDIESFLLRVENSERQQLLEELIAVEMHYRQRNGDLIDTAAYQSRFPNLSRPFLEESFEQAGKGFTPLTVTLDQAKIDTRIPSDGKTEYPLVKYFGDYELLDVIARGGMGIVYKARQVSLDRIVALKMILSGEFASKEEVKRFYSEARAAALLDHPGIVPIYEVGEHEGKHFFSMTYVEGTSLAAKLKDRPMNPMQAADMLQAVSQAVQYAHEQGVIHRDLKPSNILIDVQGRPRVTDFGLAKHMIDDTGMTLSGQVLGTPSYMPPEQATGHAALVGPASDVYALGGILYAALTGEPPFKAASSHETIRQLMERSPKRLCDVKPLIPRDLETIAHKCLEKEITRRYGSAIELADELDRFLHGLPILARPVTFVEHSLRWCQRNPVMASLASAASLLAILMAVVLPFTLWIRSELERVDALKSIAESDRQKAETDKFAAEELLKATRERERLLQIRTHLGNATDLRRSQQSGRRFNSLDELRKALDLQPVGERRDELRNHVINSLTEPDLYSLPSIADLPAYANWLTVDQGRKFWAYSDEKGIAHLHRFGHDKECLNTIANVTALNTSGTVWLTRNDKSKTVECWDLRAESPVKILTIDNCIVALFSGNEGHIDAVRNTGEVERYDALNGVRVENLGTFPLSETGFNPHPTAPYIAKVGKAFRSIQIRSTETGDTLSEIELPRGRISYMAWSPDGTELAVSRSDPWIHLYDFDPQTKSLKLRQTMHVRVAASAVCYSPNGNSFLSWGWGDQLSLFDIGSGRCLAESSTSYNANMIGRFSADGKQFFGVKAPGANRIGDWSVDEGRELRLFVDWQRDVNEDDYFEGVCIDSKRRLLVTLSQKGRIAFYNLTSGRFLGSTQIKSDGGRCLFDRNGNLYTDYLSGAIRWPVHAIADSPGTIQVGPPEKLLLPSTRNELAVDAQGEWLASAVRGNGIWTLNLSDRENPIYWLAGDYAFVDFSFDGKWIVVGEHLNSVSVRDRTSGESVFQMRDQYHHFARFSGDNRWLGVQNDQNRLISVGDWKLGPQLGEGRLLSFSADGRYAVLATDRNDLRLVELTTFKEIGRLENPQSGLTGRVDFSPEGRYLVGIYNSVKPEVWVWDLKLIGEGLKKFALDDHWPKFDDTSQADVDVNQIRSVRFVGDDDPELTRDRGREAWNQSVHLVQENKLDDLESSANALLNQPRSLYSESVTYNVACAYAQAAVHSESKREQYESKAVELLNSIFEKGYFRVESRRSHLLVDSDLTPLAQRTDFKELLERITNKP